VSSAREVGEQPVLVRGELHGIVRDRDAAGARVEANGAADDFARGMPGRSSQDGADAGEKLLHVEGLRHIVVGAGVEALDLVAPAVAGRQDDDRRLDAGAPPAVEHGDAVDLRQAEIEDDCIIRLGLAEEAAVLAVERLVDGVARMLEGGDDLAIEVFVVLDDEKTHAIRPQLLHGFDLAGGRVDRDVHETAVPAKSHDDVEKIRLDPAQIGPDDLRPGNRPPGRDDGHRRRHDLVVGDRLPHFARFEAVERPGNPLGARNAEAPEEGCSDP
jgi:hypothetical protein